MVLTMSDRNAGSSNPGTSTALTNKALTVYQDKHRGNDADLTADERR